MVFWKRYIKKIKDIISRKEFDDLKKDVENNKTNIEQTNQSVETLSNRVNTNTTNIETNKNNIQTISSKVESNIQAINKTNQDVVNLTNIVNTNSTNINNNVESINNINTTLNSNVPKLNGDNTFSGNNIFGLISSNQEPVNDNQLTTKKYVDSKIGGYRTITFSKTFNYTVDNKGRWYTLTNLGRMKENIIVGMRFEISFVESGVTWWLYTDTNRAYMINQGMEFNQSRCDFQFVIQPWTISSDGYNDPFVYVATSLNNDSRISINGWIHYL